METGALPITNEFRLRGLRPLHPTCAFTLRIEKRLGIL